MERLSPPPPPRTLSLRYCAARMEASLSWNEIRVRVSRAMVEGNLVLGIHLGSFAPTLSTGCYVEAIASVAHPSVHVGPPPSL